MLRDNGFSPLGIPRLRGFVYTIAVIDRGGEDGRLVIDARNGRIIRFVPAYRWAVISWRGNFNEQPPVHLTGPAKRLPPPSMVRARAAPRPVPHVASRTVPVPKANPLARQTCARAGPAVGSARAQNRSRRSQAAAPASCHDRFGAGEACPADCADAGPAESAGAGVARATQSLRSERSRTDNTKKTPRSSPGRFHSAALIRADPRRPGSGSRPDRAARPARGGRRPARSWSRSCAWRETVRGRD